MSLEIKQKEANLSDAKTLVQTKTFTDSVSLDAEEIACGDDTDIPNRQYMNKIYRKLDFRIIPALWSLYFMCSFGGAIYGLTFTMNMETNHTLPDMLHLKPKDISTASALDYVGTILFDLPMNLIMTLVSPQVWLARIVITTGFVSIFTVVANLRGGLIALKFIGGVVGAGVWPGLSYYISLWYPNEIATKRIGYYFTAAQLAYAIAGLVSAGFQKMDGMRGYSGWQWMYIVNGCVTMAVGISLLWWLPDRPNKKEEDTTSKWKFYKKFTSTSHPIKLEHDRKLHNQDLEERYLDIKWNFKDLFMIITDFRIWPLIIMYFGVVGAGFGLAVFGSTIISVNNPSLTGIEVSLLYAPIWLFDFAGILIMVPFADYKTKFRPIVFSFACGIIICGLCVTTYADGFWNRYSGLLIAGFGLGPTVPICMSLGAEIFAKRYGDVGAAASAALISGLGNLGSVTCTYALYDGWPADKARLFEYSNMMMVLVLGVSIIACGVFCAIRNRVRQ
jgi:MFS family permease